jgi:hypothetical protein
MKKEVQLVLAILTVAAILLLAGCQIKLPTIGGNDTAAGEDITGEVIGEEVEDLDQGFDNVTEAIDDISEETTETETAENETAQTNETVELVAEEETDSVPTKTVTEGDLVSFPNLAAIDPEGQELTYAFTSPLDGNGTWLTNVGDAGTYFVNITVSDGENEVTQQVKIIVRNSNRAPVIALLSNSISVNEGEIVILNPSVTDSDGDEVTVVYSGWMETASYKTTYNDAGDHKVTITASDGELSSTKEVTVRVNDVNRAPVLTQIQDLAIDEGDKITLLPVAQDSDGDKLSFVFSEPFTARGVWQTAAGDAGKYRVNVTVSDGELTDSIAFFIIVQTANQAPVITGLADLTVDEGDAVELDFTVTDAENDSISTKISGWMNSTTYTTTYDDAGDHEVTVTASDATSTTTKTITITVDNKNRPPVFDPGSFN